ncbi:uncharacterized protein LOC115627327 [Scaptodrosophila lebanonensis]|uniref:Uncharacterized protein LOC115627327 n=1 Tax=Drosophila lebanonensis TaxID=7225 RepID=A0A6J2TQ91_DROLE|nr:uncharacterized protein LOC115627327 [Scaptodrosophila lebanonensis]
MCLPYFSKLFGHSNRRATRVESSLIMTPRPTASMETITMAQSRQSLNTTGITLIKVETPVMSSAAPSLIMVENATTTSMGGISEATDTATSLNSNCTSAQVSLQSTSSGHEQSTTQSQGGAQTSWWNYFGMNKHKKTSIESL